MKRIISPVQISSFSQSVWTGSGRSLSRTGIAEDHVGTDSEIEMTQNSIVVGEGLEKKNQVGENN